jgi:hypothetical protein
MEHNSGEIWNGEIRINQKMVKIIYTIPPLFLAEILMEILRIYKGNKQQFG